MKNWEILPYLTRGIRDMNEDSNCTSLEKTDLGLKTAALVGLFGLILLGVSPFFTWFKGPGKISSGLDGDGIFVLSATIIFLIFHLLNMTVRKKSRSAFLFTQAWGTIVFFWMLALALRFSYSHASPLIKNDPMLINELKQIEAGSGLYLGMVGGLFVALPLAYLLFRRLGRIKLRILYYVSQTATCFLGVLVLYAYTSDHDLEKSLKDQLAKNDKKPLFSLFSEKVINSRITTVALTPTLKNRNVDEESSLVFEIQWIAEKAEKPVRAVNGVLYLLDVHGAVKLSMEKMVEKPFGLEDKFITKYEICQYNSYNRKHFWALHSAMNRIKLKYVITSILYQDGSKESHQKKTYENTILHPILLHKKLDEVHAIQHFCLKVKFDPIGLEKPTNAVKGITYFTDRFGNIKLAINTTIDQPLEPNKAYTREKLAFQFQESKDSHQWLNNTSLENIELVFVPKKIVYQDGEEKEYGKD